MTATMPAPGASAAATAGAVSDTASAWVRRLSSRFAHRMSLALLLAGTAVAYLWNLSSNGWANSFYSAAIQAGARSWQAWLFGSSDMANSITVDKPPASLWVPALSVRIFGLNPWSILVPNALFGVASVALLYWLTRRYFGHWTGMLAGSVLASTPVAALMFRFNNPEALLVLLMIAAVWACLRAGEDGRLRWMVLTGVFVGFGFLTKQLQVMLIVPPLAITYLALGSAGWRVRVGHLCGAFAAMIVSAGWWLALVELWPASSRPWIGGSQNNSILELTLGYNGFGRLNGNETGSVTPGGRGGQGGSRWGETGVLRMFDPAQGGQIAWLIPTALIVGGTALVLLRRARRTDPRRAYLVVWGLWLLVTMAVFSFMAGIFHSYYTAALAPAVAGVTAGGAAIVWRARRAAWVRCVLAVAVWFAAIWGFMLLDRAPDFVEWLRYLVLIVGLAAGAVMLAAHRTALGVVATVGAIAAAISGPMAYTMDAVTTPTSGGIISAGPRVQDGGPGGFRGGGRTAVAQRGFPGGAGQPPGPAGMTPPGAGPAGGPRAGRGGGAGGGLLSGSQPSAQMVALLRADADEYTWVAAAVGSNTAAGYQLESGYSVMPIGGFNGTDPSPTLAQFQAMVAEGQIHYFIGGGRGGMVGDRTDQPSAQIRTWVEETFTARTVDGATVYDLTAPADGR